MLRHGSAFDALRPEVLATLVRDQVRALRDDYLWELAREREREMRADLEDMAKEYRERNEEE